MAPFLLSFGVHTCLLMRWAEQLSEAWVEIQQKLKAENAHRLAKIGLEERLKDANPRRSS